MTLEVALENVAATYAHLARTLPQTDVWEDAEGLHVRGPIRHALGSFTLAKGEPPSSLPTDPWFQLYTWGPEKRLAPPGFRLTYDLIVLGAPPQAPESYPGPLKLAETARERETVARFMAKQFFPTSSREVFSQLVEATSRATALDLVAFNGGLLGRLEGAVMLSRQPHSLGLYNLCVETPLRSQGRGRKIVTRVLQEAGLEDKPCVLQCEPRLASWYVEQGFRFLGVMQAWTPNESA